MTLNTAARIRSTAGVELINLDDAAAGYELVSVSLPGESWRRITATSPVVDGEFETQAVLDAGQLEVIVRIKGATWPQVEQRRLAIRAAYMAAPSFLMDIALEGVSQKWRSYRPEVSGSVDTSDLMNKRRTLLLTFPVQPNPTMTGV